MSIVYSPAAPKEWSGQLIIGPTQWGRPGGLQDRDRVEWMDAAHELPCGCLPRRDPVTQRIVHGRKCGLGTAAEGLRETTV